MTTQGTTPCPRCLNPIPLPKGWEEKPHGQKPKLCGECEEELRELAKLSHPDD